MEFLKNKGFTDQEIDNIIDKYSDTLDSFCLISENVEEVIDYLNSYGIKNIPKLMLERIDIFYISVSVLERIFSHYDKDYIINSLDEDSSIFDELE